ncbi:MAG: hypothetical protein H6550_01420 [Chitinophagales bacterium]|nr:hypothetical protein [Chitinophagales bacterium]
MITYEKKKEAILAQYFNQYTAQIYPAIDLYNDLAPEYNNGMLNVMHTMFLCSVIDHFGKVLRVGHTKSVTPLKPGQNEKNFLFFISTFFPADGCKGDIIYKLFRNGVMHQFFPKASGVFWSNEAQHKYVLLDEDGGHPRMNNYVLGNHIRSALKNIDSNIANDTLAVEIEEMYQHLIVDNYGFNDHDILAKLKASYTARGKSLYDPC